jgi:hypothetical protein
MKKLLLTALCAFLAQISFAQITLEHTFPNWQTNVTKINATDYRYVAFDTGKSLVSIYNPDYTLDKEITLQRPAATAFEGQRFVSKNLFSNNNQYEVAVALLTKTHPGSYNFYIFNEDGSILWKGPDGYIDAEFYNMPTGTKMLLYTGGPDSIPVYSLAGYYYSSSIKPGGGANIGTQVYPNPGADHVFISVNNLNQSANMEISNMNGQVLQQLTLSPGQKSADIDTRTLPAGVYIYSIHSQGISETETGKFLVMH